MNTYYIKLNLDKTKILILSIKKFGIMYSIQLDDATYYQLQQNINRYLLSNLVIDDNTISSFDITEDPNWQDPSTTTTNVDSNSSTTNTTQNSEDGSN